MLAAGAGHALAQQTAPRRIGDQTIGIVEHLRVQPCVRRDRRRICTQAPEDLRNRGRDADTDGRFSGPSPHRWLSRAL